MGFLAVILAALAGFAVGAVWYMSLSGPWLRATGLPLNDEGKPVSPGSAMPFVVSGLCMLLVAGMMRHIFVMSGLSGAGTGLVAGLGIGAFMIAPWTAMNYAYAQRRAMLAVIDGGYAILGCGAIGLVLGLF